MRAGARRRHGRRFFVMTACQPRPLCYRTALTSFDENRQAKMINWRVQETICGLDELSGHMDAGVTHLLSILDPEVSEPGWFDAVPPRERLTLRFHDIIIPTPGQKMPEKADMERVLAFGSTLPDGDPAHLLVHCHMGISRSTAAATAILVQAHPDLSDDDALAHIHQVRGKAWPNSVMIRHADELLGREGRLIAALGRFYRRRLAAQPHFAEPLRAGGRLRELEMAEAAEV
ncbi:MAG TPA: hypothetical protein VEY69_03230 [Lautropia sp.]|nr:hypothetical protein [Lautropia sp.]